MTCYLRVKRSMAHSDSAVEELIRRAQAGDREALGRLLEQHRDKLRGAAQRQISGKLAARIDASDVVQQTCLSVYGNIAKFQGIHEGEFIAWLNRIHEQNIQNVIRDHAQTQKRDIGRERSLDAGHRGEQVPTANDSTPSQQAIRGEQAIKVARMLAKLSPDQREVVRLRHLEGWTLAQISTHLDRSEAAIIGLLKRGMQQLRTLMGPQE